MHVPNTLSQLTQNARRLQRRQVFFPVFVMAVHLYSILIETRACQGFQGGWLRDVRHQPGCWTAFGCRKLVELFPTIGMAAMSDTPVTRWDLVKAFFARDKEKFWQDHFTDEEKKLKRMDIRQLAKVINEARVRNLAGEAEKLIVAEYMLKERLARIQAFPVYLSLFTAFAGVIVGAYLTSTLQKSPEQTKCVCECQSGSAAKNAEPKVKDALVPTTPKHPVPVVPKDIKAGADIKNDGKPAEKK